MIRVKKKSKLKLLLILTAVMAVLIAGYFVLASFLKTTGTTPVAPTYDQLEWEGTDQRVFPDIDSALVDYISISTLEGNENGSFGLIKTKDGAFSLWYETEKGSEDYREYRPDIVDADPAFSYSSLYAMESFGQGKVARLFYLRSAITTMYFTERISTENLTADQLTSYLQEFGFADYENKLLGVIVNYGTTDESTNTDTDFNIIWVGGQNVSETGYYVRLGYKDANGDVQWRPYIYATNNSNIGYATMPYTYYINPSVIAAGLSVDSAYEPYLISDYRQWKNELVETPGTAIKPDAEVIVRVETTLPADPVNGGLMQQPAELTTFQLGELAKKPGYERLVRLLLTQKITGFADENTVAELMDPLYITLVNEGLALSFPEGKTSVTYTYKITKILSAITADTELISGTVPADATDLRVQYDLYIDGAATPSNAEPLHAVLSLSDSRIAAYKDTFVGTNIGKNVNISLENILHDTVTAEDIHKRKVSVYVADIIAIYNKNGMSMTTITEESIVSYRYYLVINGVKQDTYLTAADKITDMDDTNKALFLSLGKVGNGYNEKIGTYTEYLDIMKDYVSYKITEIPYMVTRKEVVHFEFQNMSERDPFYGESIYVNLSEGAYGLYGLNNTACQNVLLHLGGAAGSTTTSDGYSGSETVAIGLTPENMRKYGLYAHTLYYELPRIINGLQNDSLEGEDVVDDYTWQRTLGFTVYISDKQEDGSRYIASDLYDVIVRVVDEKLDFVEYSFVDFWARRLLVITDIQDLEEVQVEFFFDEMQGRFDFILNHVEQTNPNTQQTVDRIYLQVRPGENAYENLFVEFMKQNGKTPDGNLKESLVFFYNQLGPEEYLQTNSLGQQVSAIDNDYTGTYFFKQTLGILYSTMYLDTYTEKEQEEILDHPDKYPMLARIAFKLTDQNRKYVYEFYRASDRRVLVKIYQADLEGNPISEAVSDFSISIATFKKFMGAYDAILNAGKVTGDEPYFDITAKE